MTQAESPLKPMPVWLSLVLFGIPGIVLVATVYFGAPWAVAAGVHPAAAFPIAMFGPLFLLLVAALVAWKLEGGCMTWRGFLERFRFKAMSGRAWLWTIAGLVVVTLGEALLEPSARWIAGFVPLPDVLPDIMDPRTSFEGIPSEFLGVTLQGNWIFPLVHLACLFANIAGEELWWRGYILPRQELRHGRWAWLVNGFLWAFVVHAFMPWNFVVLLPGCLIGPYLAQRFGSTWPTVTIHGVGNLVAWGLFFIGTLGSGA